MLSPVVHATSSKTGEGIKELRQHIAYMMTMDLIQNFNKNE